jgi:hypothetical protein
MSGMFKSAVLTVGLAAVCMAGAGIAAPNCDTETGPACRSTPFPLHQPDPAIKEAPAQPQQDRFALSKGVRIDLSSAACRMKASLCHCTNAMISAKARSLGARVSAAYAFPGAALIKGDLGGVPFEIVISRERGCPVIRQRRG